MRNILFIKKYFIKQKAIFKKKHKKSKNIFENRKFKKIDQDKCRIAQVPADRLYCVRGTFGDHSGMLSDQNDHRGRVHLDTSTFPLGKSSNLVEVNKIDTFGQKPMFSAKYQRSGNEFSTKSPDFGFWKFFICLIRAKPHFR